MMSKISAALALSLIATAASADPVVIINAGFEDRNFNPNEFDSLVPNGWVRAVNQLTVGTFRPTLATWGYVASEGNNVFYANGGFIQQTTSELLAADSTYTLEVDVFRRPNFFTGYSVQLLAGDTVIAEDINGLLPPIGGFLVSTLTYTPAANDPLLGLPLAIRLGGPTQANFDNVRLNGVIPAPASAGLLVLASVFASRRRR
jgi:hypothetical protein